MLLASVIFLSAHGQTGSTAKTIEAQEFILKDNSGRVRARLGMNNEQPSIELYDEHGSVVWKSPSGTKIKPVDVH